MTRCGSAASAEASLFAGARCRLNPLGVRRCQRVESHGYDGGDEVVIRLDTECWTGG